MNRKNFFLKCVPFALISDRNINDNEKDLHNNLSSQKSHCINKCGLQVPKCESKCQMDFRNFGYSEVAKCAKNCETIEDCMANCYHNWIMNIE